MTDIYQAPSANMEERTVRVRTGGSLEDAIAGRYQFSVGALIDEAWKLVSGKKMICCIAAVMNFAIVMVFNMVLQFVLGRIGVRGEGLDYQFFLHPPPDMMHQSMISTTTNILQMFVTLPLAAGLFMLGLKLVVSAPVELTEVFEYFGKVLTLVGTTLLMYLLIGIGLCLLVLPGIYLMVAYSLAIPLVVEKDLGPWEALEASRKAITHHWFGFLGLYISMFFIVLFSMLPLLVGLLWTIPLSILLKGVLYRTVFGYEGEVLPAGAIAG
ncbi:MAG TPA: hypothetical protein VIF60_22735 [Burkholderiaceae bacterium]|jgi:hypothetical protein